MDITELDGIAASLDSDEGPDAALGYAHHLLAEVRRLRDGISAHRRDIDPDSVYVSDADQRLWALIPDGD